MKHAISSAEILPATPAKRRPRQQFLDPRQLLFINIFIANPGMKMHDVAKLAGYGPNATETTLKNMAQRVRHHPLVAYEIARRQERAARRNGLTLERHIDELARVAYSDMADFLPVLGADDPLLAMRELPAESTAAVKSVKYTELPDGARRIELALWDKNDALKAIAGHSGMRRPAAFYVPGESGQGAPVDAGDRQVTMRSMLRCLSPKQVAAWRDIIETIQAAARTEGQGGAMLEHDEGDEPSNTRDDEEVSDE